MAYPTHIVKVPLTNTTNKYMLLNGFQNLQFNPNKSQVGQIGSMVILKYFFLIFIYFDFFLGDVLLVITYNFIINFQCEFLHVWQHISLLYCFVNGLDHDQSFWLLYTESLRRFAKGRKQEEDELKYIRSHIY